MPMNLDVILDNVRAKGAHVAALSAQLSEAAAAEQPDLARVRELQEQLNRENTAYLALRDSAAALTGAQQQDLVPAQQPTPAQQRTRSEMLKSNEYARAFAYAIRNGLTPANAQGREEVKVLFDALTIGGGSPAGTDGGFLVPEDVNHMIREKMRELTPLREYFAVEPVTAQSGWRVADAAPTSGFSAVDEMGTVPSNSQPAFAKVAYALTKYGLILPISNELVADEVANLFGYLAKWGAKKGVITDNILLLAALPTSATAITAGSELRGLKTILNVGLDPAISRMSIILTNQDGFNLLDCLEDENGRPLLQWDPTTGTPRAFGGRKVVEVSNAVLESGESGAPFYLGSGVEFATLFERASMEIVSTNIGGTAFTTDSTQIRFIKRTGVSKFDADAMKKATIALS